MNKPELVEQTPYNILGVNCLALDECTTRLSDRLRDYDDPEDVRHILRMTWVQTRTVAFSLRKMMASRDEPKENK